MPFATPPFADIRDQYLRNIQNQLPDAVTGPDSDFYVRGAAFAAAVEGEYQHQLWVFRQIFPDTADPEVLAQHAARKGVIRKAANAAAGTVRLTGIAGAPVPSGTEVKTASGVAFITTAAGVIGGGGTVDLVAQAVTAGAAGNQAVNTAVTLTSAPAGVSSAALLLTMTGGTDQEDDASLLARLLDVLRNPPAGGNKYDYRRWALEVAGITQAWVFPLRRGAGMVDVVVLSNGAAPSGPLLTETFDYIEARRPVGFIDVLVAAPTFINVAVTAVLTLDGSVTLAQAAAAINAALDTYFAALTPGDAVYKSRIATLIGDTLGVTDFNMTAPVANVVTLVDVTHLEMGHKGVVTIT